MSISERKTGRLLAPLATTALLLAVSAGSALANPAHDNIVLKDKDGVAITAAEGLTGRPAFSMKQTCFGGDASGCHGDTTKAAPLNATYNDIERHSYHANLAANEFRGWNPWNPDSTTDPFKKGAGPKGKNWVQATGHIGAW